ncbi:MAG: hypothetical protein ACJ8G3_13535 [Burkholderiaceae bacterium]
MTLPLDAPLRSTALSFSSAAAGGNGGDENSMLGGRGLGCAFKGFDGDISALRAESGLASG